MHYRHNYLTNVVLRLDYETVPQLSGVTRLDIKPDFSNRIERLYPISVGQPTFTIGVNFGLGGGGVNQQINSLQWLHRKQEDGTRAIVLAPEFLAFQYGKNDYDHFPVFREELVAVLAALNESYNIPQFKRVGLRYINEINIPDGNPLDWDQLISEDLITSVLANKQEGMEMVRSMHQLQVRREDYTIVFNYGLNNPDFPNALARRVFVLDYDGSVSGITAPNTLQAIERLNDFCETMFEHSIEDGLRDRMERIND